MAVAQKLGPKTSTDIISLLSTDVDALGDSTVHRAPCTSHMYDKSRAPNLAQPPTAPSEGRYKSTGLARAAGSGPAREAAR